MKLGHMKSRKQISLNLSLAVNATLPFDLFGIRKSSKLSQDLVIILNNSIVTPLKRELISQSNDVKVFLKKNSSFFPKTG